MPESKPSDFEAHPVTVRFQLITAKYTSHQWEVQLKMFQQVFGPRNSHDTCIQGTTYVSDIEANLTPHLAFHQAVDQIIKGDRHWRPLLYHDQER